MTVMFLIFNFISASIFVYLRFTGVARLTVVYYRNQPSLPQSEDITEQPLILNTDAAFPFKTFTINGTDIKPANPVSFHLMRVILNISIE